jgi:hypothetical protein
LKASIKSDERGASPPLLAGSLETRQPSSDAWGPWVKCDRQEGSSHKVDGPALDAVGAKGKMPMSAAIQVWSCPPGPVTRLRQTLPTARRSSFLAHPGGKSLETLLFSTPHSRLHWPQNPFKMRQLKEVPIPVSSTTDSPPAPASTAPRLRVSKLCIAVQGATPAELFARADAAIKDSVFLEFRLDFLSKPAAACPSSRLPRPPPRCHRHCHLPPQAAWRPFHGIPHRRDSTSPESRRSWRHIS